MREEDLKTKKNITYAAIQKEYWLQVIRPDKQIYSVMLFLV